MKSAFKKLLSELLPEQPPVADDEQAIELATAMLLFEVAKADYQLDDSEWQAMNNALSSVLNIDLTTAKELLKTAEQESKDHTSLYPFTRIINDEFSEQDKKQLMRAMWQVAYADGELDKYEEHYLRKVADLLYIPHSQFIQQKLLVVNAQ